MSQNLISGDGIVGNESEKFPYWGSARPAGTGIFIKYFLRHWRRSDGIYIFFMTLSLFSS